jgi:hypothetical protein
MSHLIAGLVFWIPIIGSNVDPYPHFKSMLIQFRIQIHIQGFDDQKW